MNRLLQSEISKLAQSRLLGAASLLMLALAAVTSLSAWSYRGSPRAAQPGQPARRWRPAVSLQKRN